jgi:hypothetical protein
LASSNGVTHTDSCSLISRRPTKSVAIRVTHFLSQDANGRTHILIHLHDRLMGGDVAGEGNAGSPGSGGASPYQNHLFPIVPEKSLKVQF